MNVCPGCKNKVRWYHRKEECQPDWHKNCAYLWNAGYDAGWNDGYESIKALCRELTSSPMDNAENVLRKIIKKLYQ